MELRRHHKKQHDLSKTGKTLGAISKQLQVICADNSLYILSVRHSCKGRKHKLLREKNAQGGKNRQKSAAETEVSVSTVKCVLHRQGLRCSRARRKLLLQK